jgi:CRP/FNR family transcriptional regulator
MFSANEIRQVPLFRGFSDEDAEALVAVARTRVYGKHEWIVREKDPGDTFFLVTKGSVAVCRVTQDGRETILSVLPAGSFFGEMSILDSSLRSASIKAMTEVEVAAIARADFLDFLGRNAHIGRTLVLELAERLRAANTLIASTTTQDIRARVASLLLSLIERFGEPAVNGTRISLRLTNQEMANMIGTTRETVNRTLNRLWDEKLIDMRSANVVVVDPAGLRALLS